MRDKTYPVSFEVAGPAAIFTRPDSGATFVSYPVPTYSALKGMFECVVRWESTYVRPDAVEVCPSEKYQRNTNNRSQTSRNKANLRDQKATAGTGRGGYAASSPSWRPEGLRIERPERQPTTDAARCDG